jgi:hypothetical protein
MSPGFWLIVVKSKTRAIRQADMFHLLRYKHPRTDLSLLYTDSSNQLHSYIPICHLHLVSQLNFCSSSLLHNFWSHLLTTFFSFIHSFLTVPFDFCSAIFWGVVVEYWIILDGPILPASILTTYYCEYRQQSTLLISFLPTPLFRELQRYQSTFAPTGAGIAAIRDSK